MRLMYFLVWSDKQDAGDFHEHQLDPAVITWVNRFLDLTPSGEGHQRIPLNNAQAATIAGMLNVTPNVWKYEYELEIQRLHVQSRKP